MCIVAIDKLCVLRLCLGLMLDQTRLSADQKQDLATLSRDTKVNVFFGTVKAMSIAEIKTNALMALKAKGHIVPETASCVVNIGIDGPKPGCAVMFWDLVARWKYQVLFNARGRVSEVWAGAMRHGPIGSGDPRPQLPKGGVKV
jgi:hypothetical protein